AAALRRDVLDQVAACRRRRDHRPDLQGARDKARLRLRRLGLEDRLSGDHRVVETARAREELMASLGRFVRLFVGAATLLLMLAAAAPAGAVQINPTTSAVKEQQLLHELNRIQGRVSIPDQRSGVLEQPAGREWREFRNV